MSELLKCVCGSIPNIEARVKDGFIFHEPGDAIFSVKCPSCYMQTSQFERKDEAINVWNLRLEALRENKT
jgi:hypothetical protein